jgi:hypothetical protein
VTVVPTMLLLMRTTLQGAFLLFSYDKRKELKDMKISFA